MTDAKNAEKKSHVGMGIVYGFLAGAALGFILNNYGLGIVLGISLGIIIGAILDMNHKRISQRNK